MCSEEENCLTDETNMVTENDHELLHEKTEMLSESPVKSLSPRESPIRLSPSGEDLTIDTAEDCSQGPSSDVSPAIAQVSEPARRNKRKNFKPRNILQYESEGEENMSPRGSVGSEDSTEQQQQGFKPLDLTGGDSVCDSDTSPMDLSVRSCGSDTSSPLLIKAPSQINKSRPVPPALDLSGKFEGPGQHQYANMLKDYAETTMKELLSMYGIQDPEALRHLNMPAGKS